MRIRSTRPGFMMLDSLLAVLIATALLISLTIAIGTMRRSERRMADDRAASRRLEDAMTALQTSGKIDAGIQREDLPGAPAGYTWVRLTIPAQPRQPAVSLVGLVPQHQAEGGTP